MAKEDIVKYQFTSDQSRTEAAKNGQKGGIASGEARREKKLFKEAIEKRLGKSLDDIVEAMIRESTKGNVQATTFLRDTIGEKPTDKLEADVDSNVVINVEIEE